ncbi:TPA: KAP family P-loop NTPase fold protein [Photobacterium damselae]
MTTSVKIDWDEPIIIDNISYPKDTLERAKYAQYLTNHLVTKGYDESRDENNKKLSYVLNLNSVWGSGKTYFLKRWAEDLKKHHPVIYIDAWKQDYSDDPLMTVVSSITKQLREQAGKSEDKSFAKVTGKASGLFKALMPAIAGGLTKKVTGIDFVAVMNDLKESDLELINNQPAPSSSPIDMSAVASKAVQYMLDEHEGKAKAISALKNNVNEWVDAVIGLTQKNHPAFIFIDELDRCRPNYAIEMLEIIKHIFNIKGVVFVVATDTEQLQHAVKVIYGEGFDASVYLGRFFDARYTLKETNYIQFLEVHCDLHSIAISTLNDKGINVWPKPDWTSGVDIEQRNLSSILRAFNLSARETTQVMERLTSTITNIPSGMPLNLYYLVILICIKEKKPDFWGKLENDDIVIGNAKNEWNSSISYQLHLYKHNLEINIDTNYFLTTFVEKKATASLERSSRYSPTKIKVNLQDYFKAIHTAMMNNVSSESIYESLARNNANIGYSTGEQLTKDNLINWLQYGTFVIENKKSTATISSLYSRYKDLVELSISLDI